MDTDLSRMLKESINSQVTRASRSDKRLPNVQRLRSAPVPANPPAVHDPVRRFLASRAWVTCLAIGSAGLISANPLLTFGGALVPAILIALLWRTGEPPVLLFAAMFQWMQAFTPIICADFEGLELARRFGGPEIETAAWLSLMGVVCLAAGMRCFLNRPLGLRAARIAPLAAQLDARKLLLAYFIGMLVAAGAPHLGARITAARQLLSVLALVKWIPLFLLAWKTFESRRNYGWLVAAVGCEIVMGFSGFFSSFKSVLFLLLVVAGAAIRSVALPWPRIIGISSLTLALCVLWQGVKSDYRTFLNQGSNQQVELASYADRAAHLRDLVANLSVQRLLDGALEGIYRLGYLDYFAYSIRNVPARIPYQNGELWLDGIKHVLAPRALAPDKKIINDSQRTNRFTLRNVAGSDQGTSISIGYMGESYIDFGPVGMFVPIFLLGMYYGWVYRWFVRRAANPLLGMAVATSLLLFSAILLESSNVKIVGAVTAGFLVLTVLQVIVGARFWNFVCRPSERAR